MNTVSSPVISEERWRKFRSEGLAESPDKGANGALTGMRWRLFQKRDKGAADDHAVGVLGIELKILSGFYAEADDPGMSESTIQKVKKFNRFRCWVVVLTGNAGIGNAIDKGAADAVDFADSGWRSIGCDQMNQIEVGGLQLRPVGLTFLGGPIRDNQTIHAGTICLGDKLEPGSRPGPR